VYCRTFYIHVWSTDIVQLVKMHYICTDLKLIPRVIYMLPKM